MLESTQTFCIFPTFFPPLTINEFEVRVYIMEEPYTYLYIKSSLEEKLIREFQRSVSENKFKGWNHLPEGVFQIVFRGGIQ